MKKRQWCTTTLVGCAKRKECEFEFVGVYVEKGQPGSLFSSESLLSGVDWNAWRGVKKCIQKERRKRVPEQKRRETLARIDGMGDIVQQVGKEEQWKKKKRKQKRKSPFVVQIFFFFFSFFSFFVEGEGRINIHRLRGRSHPRHHIIKTDDTFLTLIRIEISRDRFPSRILYRKGSEAEFDRGNSSHVEIFREK